MSSIARPVLDSRVRTGRSSLRYTLSVTRGAGAMDALFPRPVDKQGPSGGSRKEN
jgi:hypothetical protein